MFGRRRRTIRRRGIGCLIRLIVMLIVFIAVLVLQSRAQDASCYCDNASSVTSTCCNEIEG